MRCAALLLLLLLTTPSFAEGVQAVGCKSQESAVAFAREYSSGKNLEDALEALPKASDGFRPCMHQVFEVANLSAPLEEVDMRGQRVYVKKGAVTGIWGSLQNRPVIMPLREHTRYIIDNKP